MKNVKELIEEFQKEADSHIGWLGNATRNAKMQNALKQVACLKEHGMTLGDRQDFLLGRGDFRNRNLEMKQADRLRKFLRALRWEIQEMQFDTDGFEMSRKEFMLKLERRDDLNKRLKDLRSMEFRAGRLLWKVA